jgi:hypothetical protein
MWLIGIHNQGFKYIFFVLEAIKIAEQFSSSGKSYSLYLEVPSFDLGRNTHNRELFREFCRYLRVNVRMVH